MTPVMEKRLTLSDLIDREKLAQWLAYDGNPPSVMIEGAPQYRQYGMGIRREREEKPVADAETADQWWTEYRDSLAEEWSKSALNRHKQQTRNQWLAECLTALGITGGTVKERQRRAICQAVDRGRSTAEPFFGRL